MQKIPRRSDVATVLSEHHRQAMKGSAQTSKQATANTYLKLLSNARPAAVNTLKTDMQHTVDAKCQRQLATG